MNNGKHHQKGFVLTALTVVLSVVAFIFILGYSSYYAKRSALTLVESQQAYLYEAKARLLEAYAAHAEHVDADLSSDGYRDSKAWLSMAGISEKWGITVSVSDRLAKEGVKYTAVTLWLPSEDDTANPASYDKSTGIFKSCATAPCANRVYTGFDGLGIQLKARNRTYAILNAAATKAQSYFKARYLTDVVRDISINHFRAPRGDCGTVTTDEMPCIPDFIAVKKTEVPRLIGLDAQAMTNAWGLDIEVTNLSGGSNTAVAPYTMAFRTQDPWGGPPIVIYAVQPL